MHRPAVLLLAAVLVTACASTDAPSISPGPTSAASAPTSTQAAPASATPRSSPTATPLPAVAALSLYPLPQATDLFRGAKVASMAGGRAGAVILASDLATGALISLTSADGDNWQRHWLPGSTFGGGSPGRLVGGDFGFLAVGWRYGGSSFVDALWISPDGVSWKPIGDDALPDGPIVAITAGPAGILAAIEMADGGSVIAASPEGSSWRTARLPNVVPVSSGLIALADGYLMIGTAESRDTNGGTVSRTMAWRSRDGLSWTADGALSTDVATRPNSIEGWTVSRYGAAAWDLGGLLTQVTDAGLSEMPQPPAANGHLVGSPAGLLWVSGATADGTCSAAWQWDGRQWQPLDNTSGQPGCMDAAAPTIVGYAPLAGGAVVYGLMGSDYERVAWLVRPSGQPPTGRAAGGSIPTAPATSIPDPLTATFDHLPTCPPPPATIQAMLQLDPFLGAGCFGNRDLSFRAWLVDPGEGYGGTCEAFSPMWIHECVLPDWLLSDGRTLQDTSPSEMLHVMRSPTAGGDLKGVGRWVQVTGHFDDPVSPGCRYNGDVGPVIGFEAEPPRAEAVLACRLVFVVTHLRTLPAP